MDALTDSELGAAADRAGCQIGPARAPEKGNPAVELVVAGIDETRQVH